ncbi:bifunctional nicotinamidase/pyrazinamidase [Bartonella vinsonii]|uniref:Nicotinamidase n=1 Tax=Bartonella vinsonii subsp. berkhoffii str. Tweed TaxID=1094502 RepID=N6UPW2_BARVB|nr:bifunctional nicotinamidase/pyrazinamidase [Bartonella vinsonii]AGF76079.1 pyrazinamidase /nicotinamidase Pnca [Bartonella vinsonii subsp. berkhoffii str. Winnie]ENN94384.1 pyrazinamidase /nicotinamidase Pnca [Bartonella vinsonii subsp. berkhoffii str. Tweed]
MEKKALIVIDVQNDFLPGGALAVPQSDTIIPAINNLIDQFDHVILTQDWHPKNHCSFASSYSEKAPYDTVELDYGPQIVWPDHCIQGTQGAEFHTSLRIEKTQLILRKGYNKKIDSYSAFFENDQTTPTGLQAYLKEHGFTKLAMCGLATDFCVGFSALHAIQCGFKVSVSLNACAGIDLNGSLNTMLKTMNESSIELLMAS